MSLWNRRWLWTLIFLILFVITSAIKIVVLPQGGSVNYLNLLFLWLVTYFFGFKYGLVWSVLFGLVRLGVNCLTGEPVLGVNYLAETTPVFKTYLALVLEYPLGYGVFCLGGLIKEPAAGELNDSYDGSAPETFKLRIGYLLGVFLQFVLFVISAVICYEPDRVGFWNNLLFCILYDGSYLMVEGTITFLFLCIPPVYEAIDYLKYVATHQEEDDTLNTF